MNIYLLNKYVQLSRTFLNEIITLMNAYYQTNVFNINLYLFSKISAQCLRTS